MSKPSEFRDGRRFPGNVFCHTATPDQRCGAVVPNRVDCIACDDAHDDSVVAGVLAEIGRFRKKVQLPQGSLGRWAYTRSRTVHSLVQSGVRSARTESSGGETHHPFVRREGVASFGIAPLTIDGAFCSRADHVFEIGENRFACVRIRVQAHRIPRRVDGKGVICDRAGSPAPGNFRDTLKRILSKFTPWHIPQFRTL